MPVRNFRVYLSNQTEYPLIRTDHHLCGGDWTSSDWEPPPRIEPRSERAWQSESSGIATGTEGWVKYGIGVPPLVIPGGPPPEPVLRDTVYVYWDNPYLGAPLESELATKTKGFVSVGDVRPDCDAPEKSEGRSTFAGPTSSFEVSATSHDPDDPSKAIPCPLDGSEGPLLFQIPIAPIVVLGTGNIIEQAWIRFNLRTKGSVRQALPLDYDPRAGLRCVFQPGVPVLSIRMMFQ